MLTIEVVVDVEVEVEVKEVVEGVELLGDQPIKTLHRVGRRAARRARGPCWTRASASTSSATSSERAGRASVQSGRWAL